MSRPNHAVYRLERWEGKEHPSAQQLERLLRLEAPGYPVQEYTCQTVATSGEQCFAYPVLLLMAQGQLDIAFPGYGVVTLEPGDLLTVEPHVRFDWRSSMPEVSRWLWCEIT